MKSIIIDSALFDIKQTESNGLLRSLIELEKNGFVIYTKDLASVDKNLLELIENEGISIKEMSRVHSEKWIKISLTSSDEENTLTVAKNSDYKNILEAAVYLCKSQRVARSTRRTKETKIKIKINLDGDGIAGISTGIGFFDHMLEQISRHGNVDLDIKVDGDLHVDEHHTVEDVGITLGETILKALGAKSGIKRYGFVLPMDDSIATVAIDIGGRQHLNFKCKFYREFVGEFPTELTEEFFKGVAQGMKANIYIRAKGKNDHHKIEAIFKAFAKSLNEACGYDARTKGKLPSTKGIL